MRQAAGPSKKRRRADDPPPRATGLPEIKCADKQKKRLLTFTIETDVGFDAPEDTRAVLDGARRCRRDADGALHVRRPVTTRRTFIHQLRFTLERHAKAPRRTIYLSGRARSDGARPPELLGLPQLANSREGDAYGDCVCSTPAVGDRLSGHVWFRSRWQSRSHGPRVRRRPLFVAMLRPETDKSPFGGGMGVLTLYGFDQARHEAMTAKWRACSRRCCSATIGAMRVARRAGSQVAAAATTTISSDTAANVSGSVGVTP